MAPARGRWRGRGWRFRSSGREELRNGATTASHSKNWPHSFSDIRLQPRISEGQIKYHLGHLGQGKDGGGTCLSISAARTFPVSLRSAFFSSWNSRLREVKHWPSLEWRIFIQDSFMHSFLFFHRPYPQIQEPSVLLKCEDYLLLSPYYVGFFFPKPTPSWPP